MKKYQEVFRDTPGKAKNYECILQVKEHNAFMQKGYAIPHSKMLAVEKELNTMIERYILSKNLHHLILICFSGNEEEWADQIMPRIKESKPNNDTRPRITGTN